MPAPTESSNALRRRILDSARTLVVEEGYRALTMRRLARRIGYSATSIYLHFESKDALLHALVDEGMSALYSCLTEAADKSVCAADAVRRVCEGYIDFGLMNPEYYEIMFMLHPDHMGRFPAEKYRKARRSLEVIDRALREAWSSEDDDSGVALLDAALVWANLHGAVSLLIARRLDVKLDRDLFISRVLERTMHGLGLELRVEAGP